MKKFHGFAYTDSPCIPRSLTARSENLLIMGRFLEAVGFVVDMKSLA